MELFWEISQSRRINSAVAEAESATAKTRRVESDVQSLTRRMDRLGLACQALWELAQPQLGLTEVMLREKMAEIDLRDGSADGRITRSVVKCPACGHASNSRRRHCIYCGAEISAPHAFE